MYKVNGEKYDGTWIDDKRDKGTYNYLNGDRYEGDWKNDLRHGKGKLQITIGTLYKTNNDKFVGEWVNDRPEKGNFAYKERDLLLCKWKFL